MPMWPVHTWLPDAHVEAPTAGSVILAAILLKMAGYGFLRFSIPMFPVASEYFTPLIFTLSIIAIIYTSLVALMQDDMKKVNRVLLCSSYGIRYFGNFYVNKTRYRREYLSNDKSWANICSIILVCWCGL